jgi:hypothetical protein
MHSPASLTLAEELLLVALDDERGSMLPLPPFSMEVACAAALIMDLTLLGRIDTDAERLMVISSAPTGSSLLDDVLAQVAAEGQVQSTAVWLNRLATGTELRDRVLEALVQRGVLRSVEKRLLWVFKTRVYPPASGLEEREVKSRVMALLYTDEIPEPRDALLIGLLRATGLLDELLSRSERHRLAGRIDQIADVEEINRSMSRTISELQVLLAASNMGIA